MKDMSDAQVNTLAQDMALSLHRKLIQRFIICEEYTTSWAVASLHFPHDPPSCQLKRLGIDQEENCYDCTHSFRLQIVKMPTDGRRAQKTLPSVSNNLALLSPRSLDIQKQLADPQSTNIIKAFLVNFLENWFLNSQAAIESLQFSGFLNVVELEDPLVPESPAAGEQVPSPVSDSEEPGDEMGSNWNNALVILAITCVSFVTSGVGMVVFILSCRHGAKQRPRSTDGGPTVPSGYWKYLQKGSADQVFYYGMDTGEEECSSHDPCVASSLFASGFCEYEEASSSSSSSRPAPVAIPECGGKDSEYRDDTITTFYDDLDVEVPSN